MVYVLIVGTLLVLWGLGQVVFAFIPAPPALDPYLDNVGRRLRFVVSLFPAGQQKFIGRLFSGLTLLACGLFAVGTAITRLFMS